MQYVFIDPFVGDCNERHVNSYGEMSCMENGAFIQAHALFKGRRVKVDHSRYLTVSLNVDLYMYERQFRSAINQCELRQLTITQKKPCLCGDDGWEV